MQINLEDVAAVLKNERDFVIKNPSLFGDREWHVRLNTLNEVIREIGKKAYGSKSSPEYLAFLNQFGLKA